MPLMKDLLLPLPLAMGLALHDWLIRTASNLLGFPAASKNTMLYQRLHLSFLHREFAEQRKALITQLGPETCY